MIGIIFRSYQVKLTTTRQIRKYEFAWTQNQGARMPIGISKTFFVLFFIYFNHNLWCQKLPTILDPKRMDWRKKVLFKCYMHTIIAISRFFPEKFTKFVYRLKWFWLLKQDTGVGSKTKLRTNTQIITN